MFSIIMPLYNKETSCKYSIRSILSQTYQNFELIIIDDGSTDDSNKTIKEFSISDPRIKIIRQSNQGVSSARNNGILNASNKYIAFLDADDRWHRKYLELMKIIILKYPDYLWWGCDYLKGTNSTLKKVENNSIYHRNNLNVKIIDYFENSIARLCVTINSVIILKSTIIDMGGFLNNLISGEDQDLYCRIASNSLLPYTPLQLSYYYEDAENRSCINISKNKIDIPLFPFITNNLCLMGAKRNDKTDNKFWISEYVCDRYLLFAWRRYRLGFIDRISLYKILLECRKTKLCRKLLLSCFIYSVLPRNLNSYLGKLLPNKIHNYMTFRT